MDPISESCLHLNSQALIGRNLKNTNDRSYQEILGSCISISEYQERSFKNLIPQIWAAVLVTSYHIVLGISLAYSSILIPELQKDTAFNLGKNDSSASWIASILTVSTLIGSLIVGVLMDRFGRLNTLQWAALPGIVGWVAIALSNNVWLIIIGRALTGFSNALGSNPAVVYLTEIARKDMRGSLFSFAPALTSLGMMMTFVLGWPLSWRNVAWICCGLSVFPAVLVMFVPESPAWLVSKNRNDEAKKSLMWMHKYQPQPPNKDVTVAEIQLALLLKEHELKMIEESKSGGVSYRDFLKPTAYKPLFIITGLYFVQQFSGIFIFLFYSISFFEEVGTKINPYLASMFIGLLRFIIALANAYIFKAVKKRPLLVISLFGVALFSFLTGLFGSWIKSGTTTLTWVPVVFLLLFIVFSMLGLAPIPHIMAAEMFPLEIRGVANSIARTIGNLAMFLALFLYPVLLQILGGIVGVLYFFAVTTLVGIVFVFVFVPETQGINLTEIERYFEHNFIYLCYKTKKPREKALPKIPEEALLNEKV